MNLKKILTTAVVLGIFSGTASALEIGDKMPGLFNRGITKNFMTETVIINYHPYQDKNGEIINPEDYEYATSISYSKECLEKRGMKPFAVLSFKENRIHVESGPTVAPASFKEISQAISIIFIILKILFWKCQKRF